MTRQGTMSANGESHKQDQKPLASGWMTGFDNKARLAELARSLAAADSAFNEAQRESEAAQHRAQEAQHVITLLNSLIDVPFSDIDLPGAEREAEALAARLAALNQPESDTEKAREDWADADQLLRAHRSQQQLLLSSQAVLESQRDAARDAHLKAFRRAGQGLDGRRRVVLRTSRRRHFDHRHRGRRQRSAAAAHRSDPALGKTIERHREGTGADDGKGQEVDTGALTRPGTDILDVPAYLERLRQLTEEALPEKMQRFITYLNQSSDQGVTQLLSDIDNEVSMIEERIEDLNLTLRRVDFQRGCYLRLQPQRVVHESLRELQQAQRQLRSANVKDDQGESHFRALRHMVALLRDASDRKKTVGARELLDPRYRLRFSVSMIGRDTAEIIETRTGSQGGSGGEKEIIASYVLTASLSYALAGSGNQPLFGTSCSMRHFRRVLMRSRAHHQCVHRIRVASAVCYSQQGNTAAPGSHALGDSRSPEGPAGDDDLSELGGARGACSTAQVCTRGLMKSPAGVAARLLRQWQLADNREALLLSEDSWPALLPIGRPTPSLSTQRTDEVRAHLQRWRSVGVGEVLWEAMSFRGGLEPVQVPVVWRLSTAREWVAATGDPGVEREYERLQRVLGGTDPIFRRVMVRQRSALQEKSEAEIIRAAEVRCS